MFATENLLELGGEIGITSLPVIEKRPITPKPLHIGVSFLLITNRKSLVSGLSEYEVGFEIWRP